MTIERVFRVMGRVAGFALGCLLLLVALGFGWSGLQDLRTARASAGWAAADGRIVVTTFDQNVGRRRRSSSTTYYVTINYTYTVDGQTYSGDRYSVVSSSFVSSNAEATQEVLRRYPEGAAVTVYYDPARPGAAVLERGGFGFGSWFGFLVIPMMLSIGGGLLVWFQAVLPLMRVVRWLRDWPGAARPSVAVAAASTSPQAQPDRSALATAYIEVFGAANEARQLAIVGQLAHLAGRVAPEQLAGLALQGWASPHAAVRAAAFWQVRALAARDGAWGAYFLRWAYHEALHNRWFLAHLPNPGDMLGWLQAMTQDARAYEHWRQGGVPQAAA
jgi:hypothetical protein